MLKKLHDCVIVANGAFPTRNDILAELKQSECIIACDGAVTNLLEADIVPHYIVGDLDSLPQNLKLRFADILFHNPDQETNDLTKAALFAQEKGLTRPVILGATGLREDHTLGNISLLTVYCKMFENVRMVSDFGTFIPIMRTTTIESNPGQQISLFAIFPFGSITSEGLRYPVQERKLPVWWEGTLNEAIGNSFTIKMEGEGNILIYLRHP